MNTSRTETAPPEAEKKRGKAHTRMISFPIVTREEEGAGDEKKMIVEGYAVRFNSPTVLFSIGNTDYSEQIDPEAFAEARMDDVIFNYNHGGKVMARTRNNTLELEVREDGVFIRAQLHGTEEGRTLYNEIKGGYIDRMSFRFSVREESFDKAANMWTVRKIKRLYDVSAVDIPAYDDTSIEARRTFILETLEQEAQEESERKAAAEIRRRKLALRSRILSMSMQSRR